MSKQDIPQETIDKVEEYVTKNFSKTFKNKPIIIEEKECMIYLAVAKQPEFITKNKRKKNLELFHLTLI